MAKLTIKNTRKHDIVINHLGHQIIVPASTVSVQNIDGQDQRVVTHGENTIESEVLEAAKKRSEVVAHYFNAGWLRVQGDSAATVTASGKPGKVPTPAK